MHLVLFIVWKRVPPLGKTARFGSAPFFKKRIKQAFSAEGVGSVKEKLQGLQEFLLQLLLVLQAGGSKNYTMTLK